MDVAASDISRALPVLVFERGVVAEDRTRTQTQLMQPIPNEHIARSVARTLLNIVGVDADERYKHTFINRVTPARWLYRTIYGSEERSEESYDLHLPAQGANTLKEALLEWATPERLDGDNCYNHDRLGAIEADKGVRLGTLPDTLLINFNRMKYNFDLDRMDVVTNPINVPLTLNCAELTEVLQEPSAVQYNLLAFVVGTLRRRTPDDQYIYWSGYIRVPGSERWHYIEKCSISECVQYTARLSLPTESVCNLLTGESPGGEFCMKAWYQRLDTVVQVTTPSVAAWEESWREEFEVSVSMDQGGGMPSSNVAVGVPVADAVA